MERLLTAEVHVNIPVSGQVNIHLVIDRHPTIWTFQWSWLSIKTFSAQRQMTAWYKADAWYIATASHAFLYGLQVVAESTLN